MSAKIKNNIDANKIELGKLSKDLRPYENQWIAISGTNKITGNGDTYGEALKKAKTSKPNQDVILFKVPPLDYSLAP